MTHDNSARPDISTAHDPIYTAVDLHRRWRLLMEPLGFSEVLLWFTFIDADHLQAPALNQLPIPTSPDPFLSDILMSRLAETLAEMPDLSVALLLSRPGSDGVTDDDMAWARVLTDDAVRHGVTLHPIHRANDVELVPLTVATDSAA
ncbi:hypothetical protein GTV32_03455 [Gordonia sp. SID5947]|uniref:hypothetical protein n=1 Tax=Gordonia sp. SID5947 TaxID=2690315 RepID=UPI0013683EC6|nr:hypothetical protein [Gordonia sp. SID5947]MYR05426.1 hypothetical protein [Gordonia sp. SID5947]